MNDRPTPERIISEIISAHRYHAPPSGSYIVHCLAEHGYVIVHRQKAHRDERARPRMVPGERAMSDSPTTSTFWGAGDDRLLDAWTEHPIPDSITRADMLDMLLRLRNRHRELGECLDRIAPRPVVDRE